MTKVTMIWSRSKDLHMITSDDITRIIDVLDSLGYIRKKKVTGNWYTIHCPFHKNGEEKKPSCGVLLQGQMRNSKYTEAGFFNCFTCHHSAPLIPSVGQILKLNDVQVSAVEWLKDHVPGIDIDGNPENTDDLVPSGIMSSVTTKFAVDYIIKHSDSKNHTYVSEEELKKYRFTVPYMYDRGLTDDIIDRYDIGFDADYIPENRTKPVPCITFPVRDIRGNCLFVFRRSVEGRYFNYPTGVEKPVYGLYELDPYAKTVYICESAFNLMTLVRHGLDGVALFGTGNSFQIKQLKELGAKKFVLAMDPDEAGDRARVKLAKSLNRVAFISELCGFPPGKDLNDLTEEEYQNLYVQ